MDKKVDAGVGFVVRSQVSANQMSRRRQLTAQYLRMLLNDRGTYRALWASVAGKTPPGEISQAAVAKVIVDHLRKTEDSSGQVGYRLLKDRVCRALAGQALTPSTLGMFTAAFLISEPDTRQLWALFLGTTGDEARAALQPPSFRVVRLAETHEVNSLGHPQSHRVRQKITATRDGVSRVALRFESADVAVTVPTGDIGDIYECANDLFAVDVLLPKTLMAGESFDLRYVLDYPADNPAGYAADTEGDRQLLRAVMGEHIEIATIAVKFSPDKPPGTVWWMVRSHLGRLGRTLLREQVHLDHQYCSVAKTVSSVDDVVIGFSWQW